MNNETTIQQQPPPARHKSTSLFFINGRRHDGEPDVDALVGALTGRSSL
jgi:hypothetical protein